MERLSIVITGRLGSDPRLDTTNSGTPKAIMSVAVEPRNGPDGPTRWFTVTAYRHLATHVAESLRKGDNVIVKADDIQAWTWTDTWVPVASITAGAWNTVTYTVPSTAVMPLNRLGFQVETNTTWNGTVYIDSVSW